MKDRAYAAAAQETVSTSLEENLKDNKTEDIGTSFSRKKELLRDKDLKSEAEVAMVRM